MKLRHCLGATLFLLGIAAGPAAATTLSYVIDFTGTNAPTSASFTYNSTTSTFTNFSIVWDGHTFSLTGSANSPVINGTDPCLGGSTGGAATFKLLTSCIGGDATTNTVWFGNLSVPDFLITDNFDATSNWTCVESGQASCASGAISPDGLIEGITAIPEPSSLALGLIGLGWMMRKRLAGRRESRWNYRRT
jgi:hypothetical protein